MGIRQAITAVLLAVLCQPLVAGTLSERIAERLEQRPADEVLGGGDAASRTLSLPAGARVLRDLAYGSDPAQRMDVYIPAGARSAAVIFVVHGGSWRAGDKAQPGMLDGKLARWLPAGLVIVSVNYRLHRSVDSPTQMEDVSAALAKAQALAPSWGADPARFVLLGHSAGAHLVALFAASQRDARVHQAWLGTAVMDSAVLDVERAMSGRHKALYDIVFGADPSFWHRASPLARLSGPTAPWLLVCSTRSDQSCDQARDFADRARAFGARADLLEVALAHGEIVVRLGQPGDFTLQVETFLRSVGALPASQPVAR